MFPAALNLSGINFLSLNEEFSLGDCSENEILNFLLQTITGGRN